MADTTRHQNFVTQINALLETQNVINVTAMDEAPDAGYPYCYVWLGADKYDVLSDESGPILTGGGVQEGECEFYVFCRFKTDRDAGRTGAVGTEARRLSHIIEKALKYGDTLPASFDTDDFTLFYHEVTPEFTLDFTGDDTDSGTIQVSGLVKYRQVDKVS